MSLNTKLKSSVHLHTRYHRDFRKVPCCTCNWTQQ